VYEIDREREGKSDPFRRGGIERWRRVLYLRCSLPSKQISI